MRMIPSLRQASLGLTATAWILPPAWAAWLIHAADEAMRDQPVRCGNGIVATIFAAAFLSALLSLVATVLAAVALKRTAPPRRGARWVELALIALPWLVAAGFIATNWRWLP